MAFILAFCLAGATTRADDATQFSQPPPAIYKETLAKLVTPLEDVLKKAPDTSHTEGDGIVLLDEAIHYVDESGKRISIYHEMFKALNQAGARALAQSNFTFKKSSQRVYLVLAQTIQPDGSKTPVASDAIFLKTPQEQEGDSIYDDEETMATVYSNVKPGSITERLVVLEESEPKIPGQYTQIYTWSSSWPCYWQRLVVNLPKDFADRLKITNLGQGVPSPATADSGPQRRQLVWEKFNTAAEEDDKSNAPILQTGPLVWLSTLPSWDTFATWYDGLVKGTDNLSPDLKQKIDGWTKDAKGPEAILAILYSHVAQDVRYTGFELGMADFQPHDCMSVWGRQFGDCKDKANLLRAMLAYKGITSWLTLLSTEHAGAINEASPDFRQFDHCILDVQLGNTTLLCDPTITYGAPGMLSGIETDRDVLVLKGDRGEWVHAPRFHDAEITYTFDLELRPSGELAGWVEKKATGYYSAAEFKYYLDLAKDDRQDRFQQEIRNIYPNATVVDIAQLPTPPHPGDAATTATEPFSLRAYMVLSGVLSQGVDASQLQFPVPASLLPDIDHYKGREHATYIWPDLCQISVRIKLPSGWKPAALPPPLTYDSSSANLQTAWSTEQNVLTANFSATIKQDVFRPEEMQTLGEAVSNLQAWASKSLGLVKSDDHSASPAAAETDADLAANLPTMPTGEGQINLIDSEFPQDGNRAARRAALARIPTLFPADKAAIVDAALDLAVMDLDDKNWAGVIARIKPAVDANRAALDAETIAWADYLTARALQGENKNDDARLIFQKIGDDTTLSSNRRAWAIYRAATILEDSAPVAALDYADKALGLDSSVLPSLYGLYATVAIKHGLADRLKDRLTKLIAAKPNNLEDTLMGVTDAAQALIDDDHQQEGLNLVGLLESLANPATTGDAYARAVKSVRDSAEAATAYVKLQQDLKQALTQFPDIASLEQKLPAFSTKDDAIQSMSQHVDKYERDQAVGCALRLLVGYAADKNFPDYLWDCVNYTDWDWRNSSTLPLEAFFFKLVELSDELPHSSDGYADIKLLQAKVLERKGQRPAASDVYAALAKEADLGKGYLAPLDLRMGNNWAEQGDYTQALAAYHSAEPMVEGESGAQEAVMRAAFIQLDDGNKTEAWRLLKLLAEGIKTGKIKAGEQETKFAALADGSADLPAYWDSWKTWWPQWQQIETAAGLAPVKDQKIIPAIASMADFNNDLDSARNAKDNSKYFTLLRQLAYAARDYPKAALELTQTFSTAEEVLPAHANDLRSLAIAILDPLKPTDVKDRQTRIINLLISRLDLNQSEQYDQALALMKREWSPDLEDDSLLAQAVHRVWAIAAVRQHEDLDKVRDLLEKDLKLTSADRGLTVEQLANVEVALGHGPEAVQLLETELANPVIAANADTVQDLKTSLENIRSVATATKQLADGVALWLKDHQPAWWDYAEPKTNTDPRLARLDDILNNSTNELQPAELVKAGLLAPTVASLTPEVQQSAVLKAFDLLLDTIRTQDEADAFAKSICDNPSLPDSLKGDFLYHFLFRDETSQQIASFQTFKQSPLLASFTDNAKDIVNRVELFMPVDRTSSAALTAYVQNLARRPLDWLDLDVIEDAVSYLLIIGDIDGAQAIYEAAANYTLAADARITKPQFQLTLLKEINSAKQLKPIVDAFRQIVLAAFPPAAIAKPAAFAARRELDNFDDLSEADANSFRLYLIKIHEEPLGLRFWYEFMRDLPHDSASADLTLSMLKAGLASAPGDDLKSVLVGDASGLLDLDDPDVRQRFFDLLPPYRDPVKYPLTMESIRMADVAMALRTGKSVNLETDLTGFSSQSNVYLANRYKIRAYLQAGDLTHLKTALNALPADEMMSPLLLRGLLPALEAAGLNDEAELARDTLKKSLYQHVLAAWFEPLGANVDAVTFDLRGLAAPQDIPAAFTRFVADKDVRRQSLLGYELDQAYLAKDWAAAADFGAAYTQAYPHFYAQYWLWGRSLAELGKDQEAIKALNVYCQYSLDEVEYPQAKKLLEKLSGSPK